MKTYKTTSFLVLSLLLLNACMKDPGPNQDFGVTVSSTDLDNALTAAQVESTLITLPEIQKGEYVFVERTNQVETLYPVTTRLRTDSVSLRTEDPNKIVFTLNRELRELDDQSNMVPYPTTQMTECEEKQNGACGTVAKVRDLHAPQTPDFVIPKTTFFVHWQHSLENIWQNVTNLVRVHPLVEAHADDSTLNPTYGARSAHIGDLTFKSASAATPDGTKWSYHNVTKTYSTMPLPSMVNLRSDCGGRLNPCQTPMRVIQVTWDQVDWSSEAYPVKYSYKLIFSPEAPFHSSLIVSCGTTTIPYNSQRISVMQCENVKDFAFGSGK